MKTLREIVIMRKTYMTRHNNIIKSMYLPPFKEMDNVANKKILYDLEIKIKILDWVLGDDKEEDNFITRLKKVFMRTKNS